MVTALRIRTRVERRYVNGGTKNMVKVVQGNASRLAYNYAQRVESNAKRIVHVQTGNLKRSIHRVRVGEYHHRVIVGSYYGVYENYGTRYRVPHPFWEPAIRIARQEYERDKKKVFRP